MTVGYPARLPDVETAYSDRRRVSRLPVAILAAALAASALVLLAFGAHLTFFQDSWAFILERRGSSLGDYLRPHNEHIVVIPVAIQKLLAGWFGLDSALPERLVLIAMLAAAAVLLFVYVRRRAGGWPALFAAAILLFLGPAWEVLLWPFEISLVGSVLTGLATLLALDRNDARGDVAACLLLVASVGFSSLGVAFAVGAAADVLIRRRDRGLGRLYVPGISLLLYAAWYVAYGHESPSAVSLHNLVRAPNFVGESIAASVASLVGLRAVAGGIENVDRTVIGVFALLALAGMLVVIHRATPGGFRRQIGRASAAGLWPAAAAALTFWGLAAINSIPGRSAFASRYMYVGGVFVILLAANLLKDVRLGGRGLAAAAACTAAIVGLNFIPLVEGRDTLEDQTMLTRADLGAIEIARRTVAPGFRLTPEVAGTVSLINVQAGPFLAEAADHGSPAYSPAELAAAPEAGRRQADIVLAAALPISTETVRRAGPHRGACLTLRGASAAPRPVRLRPGATDIALAPGPPAGLALSRFSGAGVSVALGEAKGGSITRLRIPRDEASLPWRLRVDAAQTTSVCR